MDFSGKFQVSSSPARARITYARGLGAALAFTDPRHFPLPYSLLAVAATLAFIAVGVYPIGLWAFNLVLLYHARKAIIDGKETPLSRSIAFLYREFEPQFFW